MRGRGRPRKTDGSPGAQKRRERDRTRKREQLERLALGQNRKQGRPRKQVAAEPTDLEQDAEVMKIPNGRPGAKRSKQLTCCRLPGALGHIKPLKPDGNPGSPGPATTSCKAVQASATVPAPVLQQQVADEELCLAASARVGLRMASPGESSKGESEVVRALALCIREPKRSGS
jgi:hypothetical protein